MVSTETSPADWPPRLIAEFDAADRRAENLARSFTPDQLNWRPRPGAWSIGQCLEHLYIANQVYLPALAAALEGQRPAPVEEIAPGWFGRWFIRKFIEPSPESARVPAPRKIVPSEQVPPSILEDFLRSNRAAREFVLRASDYDVNRIRFKNPFVPLIRFTVGTGLEILTKHQRRHLLQAERVMQNGEFPRT